MIKRLVAAFGAFQVKSSPPDTLVKLIFHVDRIVGIRTSGLVVTLVLVSHIVERLS